MKKSMLVVLVSVLMLTLACITVNVYFPTAEVQSAADKIVEDVRASQPSSTEDKSTPKESMLRRSLRSVILLEGYAYAQADIDISTPNIRALRDSIKKRFESLLPLYEKGIIGESKDGMLSIRSLDNLGLKEKGETNKLVKEENKDRENLYLEIVKANDLPADSLSQIKELFANSWRKSAKKGWWIQKDNGDWEKKDSD